jgi:alkylation response protein AidB-like acyl-CoA dehydrogenase
VPAARPDRPEAPKRKGISYFLLDMTTPGVEVRPIRNAIGDAHFCEIFLNDVEIPAANLVGVENAGWQVASHLGCRARPDTCWNSPSLGNAGFRWLVEASPVDDPSSPTGSRSSSRDHRVAWTVQKSGRG